jgi:hypothetical protein
MRLFVTTTFIASFVFLISSPPKLWPQTIYNSGSDKTISLKLRSEHQRAIVAAAGDVVNISPGTYAEQVTQQVLVAQPQDILPFEDQAQELLSMAQHMALRQVKKAISSLKT